MTNRLSLLFSVILFFGCGVESPPEVKISPADGEAITYYVGGMTERLKLL